MPQPSDAKQIVIIIHVIIATIALVSCAGAIVSALIANWKSDGPRANCWHIFFGKTYFWFMLGLLISIIPLNWYEPNAILFCLVAFSFYLVFSGTRSVQRQRTKEKAGAKDKLAVVLLFLVNAALAIYGSLTDMPNSKALLGLFVILFCIFESMLVSLYEINKNWWVDHMYRMLGSFVVMTLVVVLNLNPQATLLHWILPSAIGLMMIVVWTSIYKHKFGTKIDYKKLMSECKAQAAKTHQPNEL